MEREAVNPEPPESDDPMSRVPGARVTHTYAGFTGGRVTMDGTPWSTGTTPCATS